MVFFFLSLALLNAAAAAYDVRRLGDIFGELGQRAATGRAVVAQKNSPARQAVLEAIATEGRVPRDATTRHRIDALCAQLEGSTAPLEALDGAWRVAYSTAPPPSNGYLGPFRGEARQIIDVAGRSYINSLVLGPVRLDLEASFEGDETSLRVRFESLRLGPLCYEFPDGVERTWRLSYSDATLRIVRTSVDGGARVFSSHGDDDTALFVLTRDFGDRKTLKLALLDAIRDGDAAAVPRLVDALAATAPPRRTDLDRLLDANYDVLWTTEAELLALTDRGGAASQSIRGGSLNNHVDFEDGSFLKVTSTCEPTDPTRVYFEFQGCRACYRGFEFDLPPVGSGFFDVVYIDDDLRVSKDSRGDLQITARSPLA